VAGIEPGLAPELLHFQVEKFGVGVTAARYRGQRREIGRGRFAGSFEVEPFFHPVDEALVHGC